MMVLLLILSVYNSINCVSREEHNFTFENLREGAGKFQGKLADYGRNTATTLQSENYNC